MNDGNNYGQSHHKNNSKLPTLITMKFTTTMWLNGDNVIKNGIKITIKMVKIIIKITTFIRFITIFLSPTAPRMPSLGPPDTFPR